uniref:Uncharacterized protein n=1 Tax=Arundo donax TaxID=35708 RepID=A0A0A9FG45_ARUDO
MGLEFWILAHFVHWILNVTYCSCQSRIICRTTVGWTYAYFDAIMRSYRLISFSFTSVGLYFELEFYMLRSSSAEMVDGWGNI